MLRPLLAALLMVAPVSTMPEVVAHALRGKGIIELHDTHGICFGEARLAVYTDGVRRIPGCWLVRINVVTVVFIDGDFVTIPITSVRRTDDV